MSHLEREIMLYPLLDGFCKNRSCELQLCECVTDRIDTSANSKQMHVVIVDVCYACDKIAHNWVLLKLKFYGDQEQDLRLD